MDLLLLPQFITAFVAIITFFWAIYQFFANKYNYFINERDKLILNKILLPHFETIEINLFKDITTDNYQMISNNVRVLLKDIRQDNLFFYLPTQLTQYLISLEKSITTDDNKDNFKTINEHYNYFSQQYFKLSWRTRKHLKIEKDHYTYLKNLSLVNKNSKLHYYFSFQTVKSWLSNYLLLYLVGLTVIHQADTDIDATIASQIWYYFIVIFGVITYFLNILIQVFLLPKGYNLLKKCKIKLKNRLSALWRK